MSYCVNCGVELDESAKKCALCDTPVINPNKKEYEEKNTPFSQETFIPNELSARAKKRIALATVSVVMLIPNLVCLMLNLFVFKGSFWSLGVASTSLFLWSAFVLPFMTKKPHPYILWAADSVMAAITAFVYVLLFSGDNNCILPVFTVNSLFTRCLLPVIAVNSLIVLLYMLWLKKERHVILKLAFVFLGLAFSSLFCGLIFSFAEVLASGTVIGIICFLSLAAISGFFIYCYSSKTIRKWASKRFFV